MSKPEDTTVSKEPCRNCAGEGWVCENHEDRPWNAAVGAGCECGAGAPCPVCSREMAYAPYITPGPVSTGAQAVIRGEQIVISIDVDALPIIVSGSCASNGLSGLWKVDDPAVFAKEVCRSLNDEREDGTTRVHLMFDSAFSHAIEQGGVGIEEVTEAEFEAESARLRFRSDVQ